ncbi:hypothetical protein MOQ_009593, partial [Trypanosoma cruzi marinkellei]
MHILREIISGHPVPHERRCWLLQHLFPSEEIRSLSMITCITDEYRFYHENYCNCMYGLYIKLPQYRTKEISLNTILTPTKEQNITKTIQKPLDIRTCFSHPTNNNHYIVKECTNDLQERTN